MMRWLLAPLQVLLNVAAMAGFLHAVAPAVAQAAPTLLPSTSPSDQIEITADGNLTWNRELGLYAAQGNARAVRQNLIIEADLLTAHERGRKTSADSTPGPSASAPASAAAGPGNNLDRLTAQGNVRIFDERQKIFGDRAVYDLDRKVAVITGKHLTYKTDNDIITARDSMEYHEDENTALAKGHVQAVHDGRRMEADTMKARFTPNAQGNMEMSAMSAEGNVTVVTPNDVAHGNKALYDVKRNVAVLTGNVRITHGDTQLSGQRAEVNFTTGESRLLNDGNGRVRALLSSKTTRNAQQKAQPGAAVASAGRP